MAAKVKAIENFRRWGESAAIEATKSGGLGEQFHTCVKKLFEEMAGESSEDILMAFELAMEEVEDAAREKIEAKFGKGATLSAEFPSFGVYKSNYRAMIAACEGVFDTEVFFSNGKIAAYLKKYRADKKAAMKGAAVEKNGGVSLEGLSDEVKRNLSDALKVLRELPADKQTAATEGFKNRCFAEQRKGSRKTAASDVNGGTGATHAAA